MTYYTCRQDLESMFTCIYVAWSSGKGHQNIRLLLEPVSQFTLFDEYIHVEPDLTKTNQVITSINKKISPWFYHEMAYTSMAYEEDVLDNIYRCMILGFAYGPQVLKQLQYRDIMRHHE
ncbi:MAG: DNA metabolism protein, partial [Clostridiales bacterium]|nr:DNA metabolism protein [Candidatus Blautia equi]